MFNFSFRLNEAKRKMVQDLQETKVLSTFVSLKLCLCPLSKIPFMLKVLDLNDMQDWTEATFLSQKITCCFVPDVCKPMQLRA